MKKDIHPEWYPDAKVICNGEVVMTVGATQPELHVELWSGNHPFFTGERNIIDTEGQVERFMKRLNQFDKHKEQAVKREERLLERAQQRFLKQQLVALNLEDEVVETLLNDNIVTVGELEKTLKDSPATLLDLKGISEETLEDIQQKIEQVRETFFAKA